MELPRLSVVVRTFDSESTLPMVLKRLDLEPGDELIVVDSGSTDKTLEIARAFQAKIIQLPPGTFTYDGALNTGFGAASKAWVLSLSSHCLPENGDLLARYRNAISRVDERVTAMVGPIVGEHGNPIPSGLTFYVQGELTRGFGFGAGNPNTLYRRTAWEKRPFFIPDGGHGEDFRWYFAALAAGETLVGVHAAEVRYISKRSMSHFYTKGQMDYRIGNELGFGYQPSFKGFIVRLVKVTAFLVIGKMTFHAAKASGAHYTGFYLQALQQRRAARRKPAA
ncbi:MAG TPA: glycosyltransferase [Candidatus Limnocylindria bacterium]|jgi:glycosyltransferase involved in cell wall biosynthesis|nr:glycosyltransferase [Candidatus Limnocylindria bacterium]